MDMSVEQELESLFPNLKTSPYSIKSPFDPGYNCIAWAAGDSERWWEPDSWGYYYWPSEAPRTYSLEAYIRAFESLGFVECTDDSLESDLKKIAIYAVGFRPTHAARQMRSGFWSSKIGKSVDIEHTLEGLEGSFYGQVALIMRRHE